MSHGQNVLHAMLGKKHLKIFISETNGPITFVFLVCPIRCSNDDPSLIPYIKGIYIRVTQCPVSASGFIFMLGSQGGKITENLCSCHAYFMPEYWPRHKILNRSSKLFISV